MLLAILAFGGVFLLGNTLAGAGVGGGGGATTTVVVANQAIPLRHTITDSDLTTQKVSGTFTTAGNVYTSTSDVKGLIAEIQISKGSIITSDMLARDVNAISAANAPAYLPLASGYVAMAIPTGEQQGVAGHITLGDYITVIASAQVTVFSGSSAASGPPKVVSKTVFTNVRVIGLGPASANVQGAGSSGAGGTQTTSGITSSLTIELTQCDAEFFTWFLNNTSVRYTVESFQDYLKAPPSAPDPLCPAITTAQGVSNKTVDARYHFSSL